MSFTFESKRFTASLINKNKDLTKQIAKLLCKATINVNDIDCHITIRYMGVMLLVKCNI